MDALDNIEKRIDRLNLVLGDLPDDDSHSESLIDSIISANTLLSSAITGRDKIQAVIDRTDELERYLDPDYLDTKQDAKAREVYINTIAPELAANFEILEQIKALEGTLGAEYFRGIPDATEQLGRMHEKAEDLKQQQEMLEESLTMAMKKYDELQTGIKASLESLNNRIGQLEEKLKKKKHSNEDV